MLIWVEHKKNNFIASGPVFFKFEEKNLQIRRGLPGNINVQKKGDAQETNSFI